MLEDKIAFAKATGVCVSFETFCETMSSTERKQYARPSCVHTSLINNENDQPTPL